MRSTCLEVGNRAKALTPKQRLLAALLLSCFLLAFLVVLFVIFVGVFAGDSQPTSRYDEAQAAEIVKFHDELRSIVEPGPAIDMAQMTWSDALASAAQAWSDGCVWKHGQPSWINTLKVEGTALTDADVGQNMFQGSIRANYNSTYASQKWFDERQDYHYANTSCNPGKVCGHYTQLVWSSSKHIGCGWTRCTNTKKDFIVCNYFPGGNFKGEPPYAIAEVP